MDILDRGRHYPPSEYYTDSGYRKHHHTDACQVINSSILQSTDEVQSYEGCPSATALKVQGMALLERTKLTQCIPDLKGGACMGNALPLFIMTSLVTDHMTKRTRV